MQIRGNCQNRNLKDMLNRTIVVVVLKAHFSKQRSGGLNIALLLIHIQHLVVENNLVGKAFPFHLP